MKAKYIYDAIRGNCIGAFEPCEGEKDLQEFIERNFPGRNVEVRED